ncbi:MAG TPA: molybdenum cofactor guanylyltransferase [Terriglobia bacterium]|nr:molybdenum cofactor guanylyltransferase [Terriglobia bacterium]
MRQLSVKPVPSGRSINITGFVLAGGESRRMGRPKESLIIATESMLDRQIRLLRSVSSRVMVIGGSSDDASGGNAIRIPDLFPGRGPLGGIYTALLESQTEFNFVLGCDLPLVNERLLRYLAIRAAASGSDVTVPRSRDGRLQPLCGVYRRRCLRAIRSRLALGENKLRSFFTGVHCDVIPWTDLARAGFRSSIFRNMNTQEDYECVRRMLEGPVMPD